MMAYLVGAARTPIGGFGGALASLSAPELGAAALRAAIERAGVSPATVEQVIMGNVIAAGRPARTLGIGREAQDRFAAESYRRAQASIAEGRFRAEIVPVTATGRRGPATVDTDEEPSRIDFDRLPGLRPTFEAGGTITAANASTIADGAAALVVASEEAVRRHGLAPRARIIAAAVAGRAPEDFPVAPIDAVRKVLAAAQLIAADVDLFEVNEAFAVVVLAAIGALGLDPARVNVNGGAIALGHPIGASGARVLVTLLHALEQRGLRRGLATLCIGGGMGIAMCLARD